MLQGEGRASLAKQRMAHPFASLAKEPALNAVEGVGFSTADAIRF
jgi:hypothetical protein